MEVKIGDIKIAWMGHSSFKIESNDNIIYIDPFQIQDDIEKADFILITHEHRDHCDINSIKKLVKEQTITITTKYAYEKIKDIVRRFRIVNPLSGAWIFEEIVIKPFWAYNLNKPFHPKGKGVGFIIKIKDKVLYHMGDTDLIPELKQIKENIDVLMVPVGGFYTMDPKEALKAIEILKPKFVIPMHYNTFPEIKQDLTEFYKNLKLMGYR